MVPFFGDLGARAEYLRAHGFAAYTEPNYNGHAGQKKVMYEGTAGFESLFADDSCSAGTSGICDEVDYYDAVRNVTVNASCAKQTDCSDCLKSGSVFCNTPKLSSSTAVGDNNVGLWFYLNAMDFVTFNY